MDHCEKAELIVGLSLLFLLQMAAALNQTKSPEVCVVAQGDEAEAARLAALQAAFGHDRDRRLDLLFVIDRSKSIGLFEFNQTKDFLHQLMAYLSARGHILIARTRTRIAVLSFGIYATPEFDGISGSGSPIDACVLQDRLDGLRLLNNATLESEIPRALSRARDILASSRSRGTDANVKQIVWIFFDGAEGAPLSYGGRTSEEWATELRNDGATVFSVGVGAWLNVGIERQNRVAELATSKDHYACLETWSEILRNSPSSPGNGGRSGPFYTSIAEVYKDNCGTCPRGQKCACDVVAMNYTCVDEDYVKTIKDRRPSWIIPLTIGVCVFAFLIATIVIVCVIKKKRNTRNTKDKKQEEKSDGRVTSGSSSTYVRSHDIPQRQAVEEQVMEDYPDVSQYKDGLENEMLGWSEYLLETKNENNLLHLGIRSTNHEQFAVTPQFKLTRRDVSDIVRVFGRISGIPKGTKLKLAGKTYVLDVYEGEISDKHLHAFRYNRKRVKECAWISEANGYIIVGIAEEGEDKACCDVVYKISRQFEPVSEYAL